MVDFCLWGPPKPNTAVSDSEGEMVAYCTKKGYGTRLIPDGALKGVQWIKAPGYFEVSGFIDQTLIDMPAGDYGGELDPHGADLRGNPEGGLVFSDAFSPGTVKQMPQWHRYVKNSKLTSDQFADALSKASWEVTRFASRYAIRAIPKLMTCAKISTTVSVARTIFQIMLKMGPLNRALVITKIPLVFIHLTVLS